MKSRYRRSCSITSFAIGALAAAASCAPPPTLPLPSNEQTPQRQEILAFVNGEPIRRGDVMEMAFKWHQKDQIEEYIIWKLIQQKRASLGVSNTPEELSRRADIALKNIKTDFGGASFEQYLIEHNITERELKEIWLREGNIDAKLTNEKMVLHTLITEETIEADMLLFPTEEDAKAFLAKLGNHEDRFDLERAALPAAPEVKFVQLKPFPRGMSPNFIDEKTEQALFDMRAGDVSNPLFCGSGYLVARIRSKSSARSGDYEKLKSEILHRVFLQPPDDETIGRWIERLRKKGDVRYERRNPQGN